ncbi:MAG: IS3 family transposase [Bacteroidales bacterium]
MYGVRRLTTEINKDFGCNFNVKRIRRLMRRMGLQSVIRRKRKNYIKSTPQVTAENLLNRDFTAENPNQKWLTDVTEFKYGQDSNHHTQTSFVSFLFTRLLYSHFINWNSQPTVLETTTTQLLQYCANFSKINALYLAD